MKLTSVRIIFYGPLLVAIFSAQEFLDNILGNFSTKSLPNPPAVIYAHLRDSSAQISCLTELHGAGLHTAPGRTAWNDPDLFDGIL